MNRRALLCGVVVIARASVLLFSVSILPHSSPDTGLIQSQTLARYQIDPAQSKFMAHASRGGLFYFKGHSHDIKVGEFSGEVQLTPSVVNPASMSMTIRTDSLEETGAVFTPEQKVIIKKELNELVLESAKYPEITFRSTNVTGMLNGAQFDAKIAGEITLHGVTKPITIPATVSFEGDNLR